LHLSEQELVNIDPYNLFYHVKKETPGAFEKYVAKTKGISYD